MFEKIVELHLKLDEKLENSEKPFLSSWQCKHPFVENFIPSIKNKINFTQKYVFYSDEKGLKDKISLLHKKIDSIDFENDEIFLADGSSPLILIFSLWLFENNIKEIYYISPLYHTFYYFFEFFDIRARKISAYQPFEENFNINLPDKTSILILTDPVWYAGYSINKNIIEKIKYWQERTKSLIFIDGSMQYMKWNRTHYEHTSMLNKELTIRLICPTKILAIHSFRFSYLLMPKQFYKEFLQLYAFSLGSTNFSNTIFASEAIDTIYTQKHEKLLLYIQDKFNNMQNKLSVYIQPNCGYFIFAKLKEQKEQIYMNKDFFELYAEKFNEYIRINLLSENLNIL